MERRGFTAVETLLTLGIIAITAGISIPLYRNYQIRSDLDIATEYTIQGLHRAQVLSQSGQNSAVWGFSAREGVLFQGDAYAVRDPAFDEVYPLPASVSVSGLLEVTFQRVSGTPNQTGDIELEALNGERRIITISADGFLSLSDLLPPPVLSSSAGSEASTSSAGSTGSESSASSAASAGSSASGGETSSQSSGIVGGGSSGASSEAGGGDAGSTGSESSSSVSSEPTCTDRFTVRSDGTIETTGTVHATVKVLGSAITYGDGGPAVDVRISASTDGGRTWKQLFQNRPVQGGDEEVLSNLSSGSRVLLKVGGRYSWLFNKSYLSHDSGGHILVLRKGAALPSYDAFGNQAGLTTFLRNILDANKHINIGSYDVVLLTELDTLWKSSADFQDAVVLVSFASAPGSCAETADPKFKVVFDRLENQGNGDSTHTIYVGPQATAYAEGQWIPLKVAGTAVSDNGLTEAVPGLAAERQNGVLRILLHGSHPTLQGKEIADARIIFEHALVEQVENDGGANATEAPFDGVVNDGSGGDEVATSADQTSVLFQTRVTAADDAILIHWVKGEAASSSQSSSASSGGSTSSASSGASNQSSAGSSGSAEGGDSSSGLPADPCAAAYTIDSQERIVLSEKADITFSVLGTHATYGINGPPIKVRFNLSLDGGTTWRSLFRFRDVIAGDSETYTDVPTGSVIGLSAEGRYSWLFKRVARVGEREDRVRLLRPNESLPAVGLLKTPSKLQPFLRGRLQEGRVNLGRRYLLLLTELQDFDGSEDYQDAVVLIALEQPASGGVCGADAGGSLSSRQSSSASSGTSSSTSDEVQVIICHYPPGNRLNHETMSIVESALAGHLGHGDRLGACEADEDGDAVANGVDLCPDTYSPESVPTELMLFNRYALTSAGDIFRVGPRKKVSAYTLADTRGCSCEQLVDVAEGVRDYHFVQFPSLLRQMHSLFPFYTAGARQYGCGTAILNMVRP